MTLIARLVLKFGTITVTISTHKETLIRTAGLGRGHRPKPLTIIIASFDPGNTPLLPWITWDDFRG